MQKNAKNFIFSDGTCDFLLLLTLLNNYAHILLQIKI